ncbi:MAG: glutamine synthetase III [Kiritimatiellae bacterium]|nr:glutamine synthetase III [Kiritimatiellia bacterium]
MEPCPLNIAYGEDVFNEKAMREYLAKDTVETLLHTMNDRAPLDPSIANEVAHALKQWAMQRGATHFTHWFQPLTGTTAEKHDAFFEPVGTAETIARFSGKNLIMGEPDASSFPSGGLRCTFEARGYTAWDVTSPAFVKRHANGATLCIPTVFCSYTGEVLDKKTPLLRSMQAMDRAVRKLMACFGEPDGHAVITLGAEQEYFLVDKALYLKRPDLMQCGRTLFGAPPARNQQLEDHYFGSIKPRVLTFMEEVEQELWRLGIPAKTRHNEAAPAQFELAPMFEELNLAVDHNMLVMETLRNVADRHGLVCLLHEKPFAGVNGSGKHNNWSVAYNGKNLLDPGKNPQDNAIFLSVLASVIRAIDLHADVLRASTAHFGNDHRLGALEAPPAIISIFLGDELTEVIQHIEQGEAMEGNGKRGKLRVGVDTLPPIPRDTSDRNRTSPFAFTGNKFEFRAPGSSQNCSGVCMVLNTIVADSINFIADAIAQLPKDAFHEGLEAILQRIIREHSRVIFNGDGYSAAWVEEAQKRGLPNLRTVPEALAVLLTEKNLNLFSKQGVLHPTEMRSRYDVFFAEYARKVRLEGKVALETARTILEPAVISELGVLAKKLHYTQTVGLTAGVKTLTNKATIIGAGLDELSTGCATLECALTADEQAILSAMTALRTTADQLETIIGDEHWPLPKYRDLLQIH